MQNEAPLKEGDSSWKKLIVWLFHFFMDFTFILKRIWEELNS
jgi:hypothetical protein